MPFISVHPIFIVQVSPLLKYGRMETLLLNKKTFHWHSEFDHFTFSQPRTSFLYISQTEQKERKKDVVGKKSKEQKEIIYLRTGTC